MYNLDDRLRGLPAVRDQVVSLFESLNQPHLAIPSRQAGPARAYLLGLRGPQGFAVFVYLYLVESAQCAVYVPDNRSVSAEQYPAAEGEALGFVESMGFIMDNLNFRGRPQAEQDMFIKTLPVFQREPPRSTAAAPGVPSGTQSGAKADVKAIGTKLSLGKLFSAFCLALALVGTGCVKFISDKDREAAAIHYDLGVEAQLKDPPAAMKEFDAALQLDPEMPEAWHAKGLLLHVVYKRYEEAAAAYQKALELKPNFSDAKANLGNLYLDEKRYDDAIKLYEQALNDMTYRTPFIAHGNLGWAHYMKGQTREAIEETKTALTINPGYCLGYRTLGTIYTDQGSTEEACKQFGKYRENCPDVPDAHFREGTCLAKLGNTEAAAKSFDLCISKAVGQLKDDCSAMRAGLEKRQ